MKISELPQAAAESIGISVSSKTTLGTGVVGIWASVAGWNWTAIIASTVALVGLAANLYFQYRRDSREKQEARLRRQELEIRIAAAKEECEVRHG